jgi:hypothetical protein
LSKEQALLFFDGKTNEDEDENENRNKAKEEDDDDKRNDKPARKTPSLGIFTFSTGAITQYLELPIKKPLYEAQIFSSASVGYQSPTAHAAYFLPDERQNIITLQFLLTVDEENQRGLGFSVVISVQSLLDKVKAILKEEPDRRTIKWVEWGPDTTRWIPNHALRIASFRSTYGCRLITFLRWNIIKKQPPLLLPDDTDRIEDYLGWGSHIGLLDFGKYALQNQVEGETSEDFDIGDVSVPWNYSGEWFSEEVESRLPFRVYTNLLGNFMEAYLDGSSIIGREVSGVHNSYCLSFFEGHPLIHTRKGAISYFLFGLCIRKKGRQQNRCRHQRTRNALCNI